MSMICELFIVPEQAGKRVLANPKGIHQLLGSFAQSDSVSLEKSWHGIHFVLTGSAWEGDPPLNVIAGGGVPVGQEDVGYGPARYVDPAQVRELDRALEAISEEEFSRRFDPAALEEAEIYPRIWDEPLEDLRHEYWTYLEEMKQLVHRAAQQGHGLLIAVR
jgi:hypothetical protein